MKTSKETSRYMSAEERRAATVAALVDLAAEGNPGEITTTEIARRMGLTQGALFRHFPTKGAMIEAVMRWVSEQFVRRLAGVAHTAASGMAGMEGIFIEHTRFVSEHPGVPRLIFGELQKGKETVARRLVEELLGRYRELLRELIERGQREGEVREDLDVEAAITLFIGMIQGLVMQSLVAGNMERVKGQAAQIFAIYREGIRKKL